MTTRISVNDQGSKEIIVNFTDRAGVATIPKTVMWSLFSSGGAVINSREDIVITPAAEVKILVYGADIDFSQGKSRYLLVEGTYDDATHGNDRPFTDQVIIDIEDLIGI